MRGMLDDTLVVWGGEFGRTAYSQGVDHQRFTFWNQGLDDRLTGVEPARILREILA